MRRNRDFSLVSRFLSDHGMVVVLLLLCAFFGVVTLAAGTPDLTVDAGFYELADLGDRVWEDLDGDGVQDGGEPGVDGVEVTLYAADGTTVIATTTTAAGGAYLFADLAPGGYVVGFAAPSGTTLSTPDLGGDDTRRRFLHRRAQLTLVDVLAAAASPVQFSERTWPREAARVRREDARFARQHVVSLVGAAYR